MKVFITMVLLGWGMIACAQQSDCKRFKNGKFKQEDSTGEVWMVERKGSKQIEYNDFYKMKLRFKVKWKDECTYTLKLKKILENPDKQPFPEDLVVTVNITDTKDKSFNQTATSSLTGKSLKSKVTVIE